MENFVSDVIDKDMRSIVDNFFSVIPGIDQALPVAVLDAETLEEDIFKRDWVAKNKPCLIKGAVKHWPAVKKWKNRDYWKTLCTNFSVTVYPHPNYMNNERQNAGSIQMSFYQAMDRLFSNSDRVFSMPSQIVTDNNRFAKLKTDFSGFSFLRSTKMPRVYDRSRLFIYRRAATNWHYHGTDETLMCQINGTKRVALLSPEIPKVGYVTNFLLKELQLNGQTLDGSLKLNPYITTVEEGDALYIPPYWHHAVVPSDGEIGYTLAYCWRSPDHKLGDFSNYFVRKLYKFAFWPLKRTSVILPFFAGYAFLSYFIWKVLENKRQRT